MYGSMKLARYISHTWDETWLDCQIKKLLKKTLESHLEKQLRSGSMSFNGYWTLITRQKSRVPKYKFDNISYFCWLASVCIRLSYSFKVSSEETSSVSSLFELVTYSRVMFKYVFLVSLALLVLVWVSLLLLFHQLITHLIIQLRLELCSSLPLPLLYLLILNSRSRSPCDKGSEDMQFIKWHE